MDASQLTMNENRGPHLEVLIVVLTVISAIVVMLRLYTRLFVQRGTGWDDAMMVVGMVRSVATKIFWMVVDMES